MYTKRERIKIGIIGGSGFIGGHLVRCIGDKHSIRIIDIKAPVGEEWSNVTYVHADVRKKEEIEKSIDGLDVIVNLAAEHKDNVLPVSLYYEVNVDGAKNVCDSAEKLKIPKIIFTSSVAVYGLEINGCDENTSPNPTTDYGISKLMAEKIHQEWFERKTYQKDLVIFRPAVIFGVGNRGNVYNILTQIINRRFIMIGSGENKKSMGYVENLVACIKKEIEEVDSSVKLINYADQPTLTMKEFVEIANSELQRKSTKIKIPKSIGLLAAKVIELIIKLIGIKSEFSVLRVKKFTSNSLVNSVHKEYIVKNSRFSLNQGIRKMIKWMVNEKG